MQKLLIVAISLLPSVLAFYETQRQRTRLRGLRAVADLFERMRGILHTATPEAAALFGYLASGGCRLTLPRTAQAALQDGASFAAAWKTAVEQDRSLRNLTREERAELLDFAMDFGGFGQEEQERICAGYAGRFEERSRRLGVSYEKNERLYPSAGMLGSALLLILLL